MNGLVSGGAPLAQYLDDAAVLRGSFGALAQTLGVSSKSFADDTGKDDPVDHGWLLVVPDDDEGRRISAALAPLVERRVGADRPVPGPVKPEDAVCYFPASAKREPALGDWVLDQIINRSWKPGADQPFYVLVAASPDKIPFDVDYQIAGGSRVGRLAFANVDDYATYARKVVAWERADDAANGGERGPVGVFATDHGSLDPTRQSRKFLAGGLLDVLATTQPSLRPTAHLGDEASLATLMGMLRGEAPGFTGPRLLFSATHGLAVSGSTAAEKRDRLLRQGGICCQHSIFTDDEILTADRLGGGALLAGGIWAMFACFGAGTPAASDFFEVIGDATLLGFHDGGPFLAALPASLLANPDGPLAVIGHLDPGFETSISNQGGAGGERSGKLIATLVELLGGGRAGVAMGPIVRMADSFRIMIMKSTEAVRKELGLPVGAPPLELGQKLLGTESTPAAREMGSKLVDRALTLNDFRNFVILGDPAVRLPHAGVARGGAAPAFSVPAVTSSAGGAEVPPPIAAAQREGRLVLASAEDLFSAAGVPIQPEVTTVVALVSSACTDVAEVRARPPEEQPAGVAVPRYYEAVEHQDCDMTAVLRFSATDARPAPAARLTLENGVRLRYGEAISLFGDFYGIPGVRLGDGEDFFLGVWSTFAHGDAREMCNILDAMAKERAVVVEAQDQGASVADAYARAGNELNGDYNRATGGGSFVSSLFPQGRFLKLASVNFDHFGADAMAAYRAGHAAACHAARAAAAEPDDAARRRGLERAYLMNACADHFLTDLFASGHLRVPRRALHERGWIDLVGDLLAKCMHDEDNRRGLAVRNARGDAWQAFGDQRFHADEHAEGRALAREAVAISAAEVWAAFDTGAEPAFGALRIVPDLGDALTNAANHAPLFILDGGVLKRRQRLTDLGCRDYTDDWNGVATLLRESLHGGT
jgi:hypothetical protein